MVGWGFIFAGALLIFVFSFYPIIRALILSFQTGVGTNMQFAGLFNYQRLLADKLFKTSLGNVFIYLVLQVPLMLILALFLAHLLNDKNLKYKAFFRTALFLPCATSLVSYAIIFRSLFALDGFVNAVLMNLKLIAQPINWIGHPWTARLVIVLALTWRWTGYNMVFFLAGLQNIDSAIYEAAVIDGASEFTRFTRITIPMPKTNYPFNSDYVDQRYPQLFDETMNITRGGPANTTLSVSQYIYKLSFQYSPRFGYAAAISFVVFILVALLSLIQMKVGDKR